jgi:hypothetical protein
MNRMEDNIKWTLWRQTVNCTEVAQARIKGQSICGDKELLRSLNGWLACSEMTSKEVIIKYLKEYAI